MTSFLPFPPASLLLVLTPVLIAGCGTADDPGAAPVAAVVPPDVAFPRDTDLHLSGMPGSAFGPAAPGMSRVTLRLTAKGVSGCSGVNRYFGPADFGRATGGYAVHVGRVATTRMAGDPEAMRLETEFLGRLAAATTCRYEPGIWIFADGEGRERLRFIAPVQ